MLENTRAIGSVILEDLRRVLFGFKVSTLSLYIIYLVYAIIAEVGKPWANAVLLLISAAYLVFYCINHRRIDGTAKEARRLTRRIYALCKIAINGVTLAITVYGLFFAASEATLLNLALTLVTAFGWVISVLLEMIYAFVLKRYDWLVEAIKMDIAPIIKGVEIFKRVKGEEIPDEPPSKEREKTRSFITSKASEARINREAERARKKARA